MAKKSTSKATKVETATATHAKKENAAKTPVKKTVGKKANKKIKVRITGPVAWLGYPWNMHQEVTVDENEGNEMVDQKVAVKI